jgi:hypothetical protein
MTNQPSRFITYPDIIDKSDNHTVLLIDADMDDVANLATFCTISKRDYDIYLYRSTTDDLEWLAYLSNRIDHTMIKESSELKITNSDSSERFDSIDGLRKYFTTVDEVITT